MEIVDLSLLDIVTYLKIKKKNEKNGLLDIGQA